MDLKLDIDQKTIIRTNTVEEKFTLKQLQVQLALFIQQRDQDQAMIDSIEEKIAAVTNQFPELLVETVIDVPK